MGEASEAPSKKGELFYGYYVSFDATGEPLVDAIIREVAHAARRAHHTEDWRDKDADGESSLDHIYGAAEAAVAGIAALTAERDALRARVAELEAEQSKWTRDVPTVPGWYWLRGAHSGPFIGELCSLPSDPTLRLWVAGDDGSHDVARAEDGYEWCGPLEAPP